MKTLRILFLLWPLFAISTTAHAAVITTMSVTGGEEFNTDTQRMNLLGAGFTDTGNIYTSTHIEAGWGTGNHWLGGSTAQERVVEFSLGGTYTVNEVHIWNMNTGSTYQADSVDIIFSENATFGDADDTEVNFNLFVAAGYGNSYTGEHFTFTSIANATHVRLEATGSGSFVGLSEFRVSQIPEPSSTLLVGLAVMFGLLRRRR